MTREFDALGVMFVLSSFVFFMFPTFIASIRAINKGWGFFLTFIPVVGWLLALCEAVTWEGQRARAACWRRLPVLPVTSSVSERDRWVRTSPGKSSMIIALALAVFHLGGCGTKSVNVSSSSPIRATYEQGTAVLVSQKTNGVVLRVLTAEFSKNTLPSFYVAVSNGGDSEIEFSTSNLSAFSGKERVRVYTYEELDKKIRREAAMAAAAAAMNGASQSISASMPVTTYSSGSAYSSGSGGYAGATYYETTTAYDPAAAAAAQAQINAQTTSQMSMIASARNIQLDNLGSVLRRNTLRPGASMGGVAKLHSEDIESGQPLEIIVSIGGETHEFVFDVGK
jgi:hypothetical protein